jgi:hypothetical protein
LVHQGILEMSDHALPTLTQTYTNFLGQMMARIDDSVKQNRSDLVTLTNPPTGTIRWNAASALWESNTGTAGTPVWSALSTTYNIRANTAFTWDTGRTIAITGDGSGASGAFDGSANTSFALTLATVNPNVGDYGSAIAVPVIRVNGKGLITQVATAALGSIATQAAGGVSITGGAVSGTAITLVQSTTAAPTVEGRVEWDTDNDTLMIGNGAATKVFTADNGATTLTNKTFGDSIKRSVTTGGYLEGAYPAVESSSGTPGCIYTIGGPYQPGAATLGNMYGVGYSLSGGAGIAVTGLAAPAWGLYGASAGVSRWFLDSDNGTGYFNTALYAAGYQCVTANSGTWAISISGNAATATTATTATSASSATYATTAGSAAMVSSIRTGNTLLAAGDSGKFIDITSGTFSQTITAASTLGNGWWCYVRNRGTGTITLTPSGGTVGGTATLAMSIGDVYLLECDGTNFNAVLVDKQTFSDDRIYSTSTTSATFTVPANVYAIRAYLFGAGGAGAVASSSGGGGGGGCSYGTIPTLPGTVFTFTISGAVTTLNVGGTTYLTANGGSAGSGATGGAGGAAGSVGSGLNIFGSGAYAGGAGGTSTAANANAGGGASGSPIGIGGAGGAATNSGNSAGAGGGWGGKGGDGDGSGYGAGGGGVGGAGGSSGAYGQGAGGGAGGAATDSIVSMGNPGIGRSEATRFTDPLLAKCIGCGTASTSSTPEPGGGSGGGYNVAAMVAGFGGGGCSVLGLGSAVVLGGGGGCNSKGGLGGLGGGGGGSNVAAGAGGNPVVFIYY